MDIHEYQAKEILSRFGVAVPPGGLAYSPEQAAYRARDIGGAKWIVKAQIHSGGRGKAGGVKLCSSEHQVEEAADTLFGKRLVTQQTGPQGKTVYRVYVEGAVAIKREIYLGLVLDRKSERVMVVASSAGGMEIEEIAEGEPQTIIRSMVETIPLVVTEDNRLIALDAKMTFDDNALFRLPHIAELRDKSQEDARETRANDRGLSYVGLDGEIGCIV